MLLYHSAHYNVHSNISVADQLRRLKFGKGLIFKWLNKKKMKKKCFEEKKLIWY